jgi:radical SAM enzyme (TIGR01210 family)
MDKLIGHLLHERFDFEFNKIIPLLDLYLAAGICVKSRTSGPCKMCVLPQVQASYSDGQQLTADQIMPSLEKVWRKLEPEPTRVRIFHGGNFLAESEISAQAQIAIIGFLDSKPSVRKIEIETRPDVLLQQVENLNRLVEIAPGKIQVDMGIETIDEAIRNGFLNKNLSDEDIVKATKLLQEKGVDILFYLLHFILPLELYRPDTVEHSLGMIKETVKFINKIAPEASITISSLYMEDGSPLISPWQKVSRVIPSLKTVTRALIKARNRHPRVYFGGIWDAWQPKHFSHGCPICEQPLLAALRDYQTTCDAQALKDSWQKIDCPC